MIDLNTLRVRVGQRMNSLFFQRIWNKLLRAIEERTIRNIPGASRRQTPSGRIFVIGGGNGGGSRVTHPWLMDFEEEEDKVKCRFAKALINGVEPKLDEKPMSVPLEGTGEIPALTVNTEDFGDDGVVRIYARVSFDGAWQVVAATLVAKPKIPPTEGRTAHKLISLLIRDAAGGLAASPRAFFDLRVEAIQPHGDRATYLWWIDR